MKFIRKKAARNSSRKNSGTASAFISVALGAALFGIAVNMFLLPAGVVTGGASGIATAIAKVWGTPVGLFMFLVNLPLFILCIRRRGVRSMMYSIIGTASASVASDLFFFLSPASSDPLMCALIGGTVMGIGSGLLLASGFTTGGTDLAAYLIHTRYPAMSTGKLILALDAAVIVFCAAIMQNYEGIMYSVICTVTYSASLDMVQSTSRRARITFIISEKADIIAAALSEKLDRGVTLLSGSGFYTGKAKDVIMCVVNKHEEFPLRELVTGIDPDAFIVIGEAAGVHGNGFAEPDARQ